MNLHRFFALAALFVLPVTAVHAENLPFSQTLTSKERAAAGINKLSGQQVEILDALVAREEQDPAALPTLAPLQAVSFSRGLAPDKRYSAGLDRLNAAELTQLDSLVHRTLSDRRAEESSAKSTLQPQDVALRPQIHGEAGVMFAVGNHGYSAYGGFLALCYVDPADRYAVSALYSETHVKGDFFDSVCRDEKLERKKSYVERDASVTFSFGHGPLW